MDSEMRKRGQSWSIETYLSIAIFLIAVVFFWGLTLVSKLDTKVDVEIEQIGRSLISTSQLSDGKITPDDLAYFLNLNCTALKQLYRTNTDLCIYFVDGDNNLIILENESTVFGVGCPSIEVSGKACGTVEKV
jgi:hypothetical protein